VSQEEETVSKLSFTDVTDFKFLAAYGKYSELFDNADIEKKLQLNDVVSRLNNNEIDYSTFYYELNKLSETQEQLRRFHRSSIKGQRKRAYNKDQQKRRSITRHKR
jgi:hypothetical protein